MSFYFVHTITMQTEKTKYSGEVFHLSLEHDPRGSPSEDKEWRGGRYQANGIERGTAIKYLRSLANRLEEGKSLHEIIEP